MYTLLIRRKVQKQIEGLPGEDEQRVRTAISELRNIPRPHGCVRLAGEVVWRIRVGDYRVIYEIDDATQRITLLRVAHRKEVYRP